MAWSYVHGSTASHLWDNSSAVRGCVYKGINGFNNTNVTNELLLPVGNMAGELLSEAVFASGPIRTLPDHEPGRASNIGLSVWKISIIFSCSLDGESK